MNNFAKASTLICFGENPIIAILSPPFPSGGKHGYNILAISFSGENLKTLETFILLSFPKLAHINHVRKEEN